MNTKENWLINLSLGIVVALLVGSILFFQPYYGLMDDHYNWLKMLPEMEQRGLFVYAWEYAQNDISWGMFRPTNPLMVYLLYKPAALLGAPWFLYLWNLLFSLAALALNAVAFARITKLPARWIAIVLAGFFYAYDLFQHPSLQEKMMLMSGGGVLYLLTITQKRTWHWCFLVCLCLFGILVKASFVIYLSMAVWLRFSEGERTFRQRFLQALPLVLLTVLATVFFAWVSKQGSYTGMYSLSKVLPQLKTKEAILFLVPSLLWILWERKSLLRFSSLHTPLVGVLAFLVLFLPWGIQAYIQSIIAPAFCALVVLLAVRVCRVTWLWLIPACVLAISVSGYRSYTMFQRLGDLGRFVQMAPEIAAKGIEEIQVPCFEGRDAIERYFAVQGVKGIRFPLFSVEANAANLQGKWLIYDGAMCPLPGRILEVPGCRQNVLLAPSFAKSYRLVQFQCEISP